MLPKQPYPGLLIATARRRIRQAVLDRVADRQLTAQQFWMIIAIRERPGISQAEIAARTHADAPRVSRALTGLADRGIVRTGIDPADRRRTLVRLTSAGQRVARELMPVARELRATMVAGMSAEEVAALCALLERLVSNLATLARPGPADPDPVSRAATHPPPKERRHG